MNLYYDRDGHPIDDLMTWGRLMEDDDYKRVAWTEVCDGVVVSTVWLGINHNWRGGPPLIFETMVFVTLDEPLEVFGQQLDREGTECYRYPTEAAALAGHDQVVADLRAQLPDTSLAKENPDAE